jgi:hypothetical protein
LFAETCWLRGARPAVRRGGFDSVVHGRLPAGGEIRSLAGLILFFTVPAGSYRETPFTSSWANAAAANGLVAIVPDLRSAHAERDFRLLVSHLANHAADYGINRAAIALYAGSGNVS